MAIEGVILLTVLISAFMFITKYVREKKLISGLVQKPMQSLSVMTAYGAWGSSNGAGCQSPYGGTVTFGKCHPNSYWRSQSPDPSGDQ